MRRVYEGYDRAQPDPHVAEFAQGPARVGGGLATRQPLKRRLAKVLLKECQ